MSRETIRTSIQGAVDYVSAHPTEARYTDSVATAKLADPAGLKVVVEGPDGATLTTDMPVSVGGTNSAPSPGWFLRASAAACVAALVAMRAARLGVELDDLEVTVDSESDDRGILGIDEAVPAGPFSTRVAIRVSSAGTDRAALEEVCRWAVEHCPVTDSISRAVPLTVEVA